MTDRKDPKEMPRGERIARRNLEQLFGRMTFEKGQAYSDEVKKEEKFEALEALHQPARRKAKRDPEPSKTPPKPPQAFPGP